MTQVVRNFYVNKASNENRTILQFRRAVRNMVLNYVFRDYSFFTPDSQVREIPLIELRGIAGTTKIPLKVIDSIVSKFLTELKHVRGFFKNNSVSYTPFSHLRKMKIYLHKFYRLAPVFDIQRAKINAQILATKLTRICFWPQFMTQVAVVIYITDLNDSNFWRKLRQTNIRALSDCSAYAFHRTRNKLGLN
ncbi:MAG: hypothetical protein KJI71_04155 [Patescibacteria group bacterium]|nr:hypothetical protein [Patescibacteria group bacterium]